jgi:hypothetical protein
MSLVRFGDSHFRLPSEHALASWFTGYARLSLLLDEQFEFILPRAILDSHVINTDVENY